MEKQLAIIHEAIIGARAALAWIREGKVPRADYLLEKDEALGRAGALLAEIVEQLESGGESVENPTKEQVQGALTAARKALAEASKQVNEWQETERRYVGKVMKLEAKLRTFYWKPNATMLKDFFRSLDMNAEEVDYQLRKGDRVHVGRSGSHHIDITRQDGERFTLPSEFVQLDEEKGSTL